MRQGLQLVQDWGPSAATRELFFHQLLLSQTYIGLRPPLDQFYVCLSFVCQFQFVLCLACLSYGFPVLYFSVLLCPFVYIMFVCLMFFYPMFVFPMFVSPGLSVCMSYVCLPTFVCTIFVYTYVCLHLCLSTPMFVCTYVCLHLYFSVLRLSVLCLSALVFVSLSVLCLFALMFVSLSVLCLSAPMFVSPTLLITYVCLSNLCAIVPKASD